MMKFFGIALSSSLLMALLLSACASTNEREPRAPVKSDQTYERGVRSDVVSFHEWLTEWSKEKGVERNDEKEKSLRNSVVAVVSSRVSGRESRYCDCGEGGVYDEIDRVEMTVDLTYDEHDNWLLVTSRFVSEVRDPDGEAYILCESTGVIEREILDSFERYAMERGR